MAATLLLLDIFVCIFEPWIVMEQLIAFPGVSYVVLFNLKNT